MHMCTCVLSAYMPMCAYVCMRLSVCVFMNRYTCVYLSASMHPECVSVCAHTCVLQLYKFIGLFKFFVKYP